MEDLLCGDLRLLAALDRRVPPPRLLDPDPAFVDRGAYVRCVTGSLRELVAAGVIDESTRARFQASALAP